MRLFVGKIREVEGDKIGVLCLDNGHSVTVSPNDTYKLRSRWVRLEQQAINCRLKMPEGMKKWPEKAEKRLVEICEMAQEHEYWNIQVLEKPNLERPIIVELHNNDGVSLADVLLCDGKNGG